MTDSPASRAPRPPRSAASATKPASVRKPAAAKPAAAPKAAVTKPAPKPAPRPATKPAAPVVVLAPGRSDDGHLSLHRGGIGALTATDVAITQGGVGALRSQRLTVDQGGVGAAMTSELDLRQGIAGAVIARDARFEQAGVRTLIANRVHFGPNSGAGVVVAAHVEGNVRTLFDWRGALAFGAAVGAVVSLLRFRRR